MRTSRGREAETALSINRSIEPRSKALSETGETLTVGPAERPSTTSRRR